MTKKYAKKLSLEVWEYLRDHPEIKCKRDLPSRLYKKIELLSCNCPLCELFIEDDCMNCPLEECFSGASFFDKWGRSTRKSNRARHASKIVEKIKAWEIK